MWFGLAVALLVGCYVAFTGPRDLHRYPDRATSPYRLPWPAGVTRLCAQSNRGIVSHRGWEEFAYDFAMPVGSPVCAARAGTVVKVQVSRDGRGLHAPNNDIWIDHVDGTRAAYLHLQRDGSLVQVGERVRQGQPIARSGNVGRSLGPHLHFYAADAHGKLMRVSFQDVPRHAGVPRMLFPYTSGNIEP